MLVVVAVVTVAVVAVDAVFSSRFCFGPMFSQELKVMLKTVKTGKGKVRLKSNDKSAEDGAQRALEKAKKAKANAETDAEKVR